jgi:hypothetical protein
LKATFEREMQTLERESQSVSQVAQVTASDIFSRAINYNPEPEVRSLPPAETAWNSLEPQSSENDPNLAYSSTATEPSTVDASAVSGVESNGTVEEAVSPPPESIPGVEGTVPRTEAQPQNS